MLNNISLNTTPTFFYYSLFRSQANEAAPPPDVVRARALRLRIEGSNNVEDMSVFNSLLVDGNNDVDADETLREFRELISTETTAPQQTHEQFRYSTRIAGNHQTIPVQQQFNSATSFAQQQSRVDSSVERLLQLLHDERCFSLQIQRTLEEERRQEQEQREKDTREMFRIIQDVLGIARMYINREGSNNGNNNDTTVL